MKLSEFYKKFDKVPREERFDSWELKAPPTSLFVIFQKLTNVRGMQRHYEELERGLLNQAEEIFHKMENDN